MTQFPIWIFAFGALLKRWLAGLSDWNWTGGKDLFLLLHFNNIVFFKSVELCACYRIVWFIEHLNFFRLCWFFGICVGFPTILGYQSWYSEEISNWYLFFSMKLQSSIPAYMAILSSRDLTTMRYHWWKIWVRMQWSIRGKLYIAYLGWLIALCWYHINYSRIFWRLVSLVWLEVWNTIESH